MKQKIIIENLSKSLNGELILSSINLQVNQKDSLVIVGESGSGKSVLIKCIAGLFRVDSGAMQINNIDVGKQLVSERTRCIRDAVGMLFQGNALFDSMTIEENITFAIYNNISRSGYLTTEQRIELHKIAKEHLDVVGLSQDNLSKYPYELSGGMQKRVAIARLISTKPEIMLLDEPTTGLDPLTSYNISRLLLKVQSRINATMLTITHDPICAAEIASRLILIENKTIAWQGMFNEIPQCPSQYVNAFKHAIN